MGSFSVSCGMSKLPITSDEKILFVALEPATDASGERCKIPLAHLTYREQNLYKPFFLPIKGNYNTYGSLENIERDYNVELLENYYNKSIDDILKTIMDNRGMFDSFSETHKIWDLKLCEKNSLNTFKDLGFELIKFNGKEVMYNSEFNFKISNNLNNDSNFKINEHYILNHFKTKIKYEFD